MKPYILKRKEIKFIFPFGKKILRPGTPAQQSILQSILGPLHMSRRYSIRHC